MKLINLTDKKSFPNTAYRFSSVIHKEDLICLKRDFMGENPLHYYLNPNRQEVVVANSIRVIKEYLEEQNQKFLWGHMRATSNNKEAVIAPKNFYDQTPEIKELSLTLQEMPSPTLDFDDMAQVGLAIHKLLEQSVQQRVASIKDEGIGILLSGGLDSITTAYFLKKNCAGKHLRAFTLKVREEELDVVKSREIAKLLNIPLTEVKVSKNGQKITVSVEVYSEKGLLVTNYDLPVMDINEVIENTLAIAENPKKDNLFCSLAMYLIGQALKSEGVGIAFCGEGPNEMINDYGFKPQKEGYPDMRVGSTAFRQSLTFGLKEADLQLGRGGLGKHALCRMGKIFGYYGIRLESPFFDANIANIMTRIPYRDEDYGIIKPRIVEAILGEEGNNVLGKLEGISKEKFQDGSGISKIFGEYDQKRLNAIFEGLYGVRKESYLK